MDDDRLTIEQNARKWALHLACTAGLTFGRMDVMQVAAEFADYLLTGALPKRLEPSASQRATKRWFA